MTQHRRFDRIVVRRQVEEILRTGRDRIVALGGDCDPLSRMTQDTMHMLDQYQTQAKRDGDAK